MATAGTKVSALNAANALDGSELLYVVQGGSGKKGTVDQVKTAVNAAGAAATAVASHVAAGDPHPQYAPKASPALTGTPTAPTAAPGTSTTQVATTAFVAAAVAAAAGDVDASEVAIADAGGHYTSTDVEGALQEVPGKITTAVNALVNAAPGALDTLDELAAALGDDANFAATVTAALAAKAPLASPALTGNPTAPTQTAGDSSTKLATTAFVAAAIASVPTGTSPTGNQRVSGGGVGWDSDLDYNVSACVYYIQGVLYSSPADTVTLDPGDPTDPRIDVIAVDNTGAVVVIEGTPAPSPVKPDVDPATQLELTFVPVAAGATVASVTITHDIYHEGTEWTDSETGTTITIDSANNPRNGTKCIEGTAIAANDFFQLQNPGGNIDLADSDNLVLWLRSKATWPSTKSLGLQWRTGNTTPRGSVVTVKHGTFGFDSSITGAYQQIVIPTSLFGVNGIGVDRLRFTVAGAGSAGFYFDDCVLQAGVNTTPSAATDRLRWTGPYVATKAYEVNDLSSHLSGLYVRLTAGVGGTPGVSSAWQLLIQDTGGGAVTAASVTITDAGAHYTGTDVEAALQEVPGKITAAINAVINSAPGALDTLDELAAALGDDANFATTVTNALAAKAPLASPALTGNPTAPTQSSGDNSTKLATTAYVDAAVAVVGGGTELRWLTFTSDTGNTADSDPTGGQFKWNNGTQGSATTIYFDSDTADSVAVGNFFAALRAGGNLFIQQADTPSKWQVWKVLGVVAGSLNGYYKIVVSLLAKGADIDDNELCLCDFRQGAVETWAVACSDLTTAITSGTNKAYFVAPYAANVLEVQASLDSVQASGSIFTVDINETASSILSTKLTIDNSETSSITAATPPVISDTAVAKGAKLTFDVDQVGDGTAKGLIVYVLVSRAE